MRKNFVLFSVIFIGFMVIFAAGKGKEERIQDINVPDLSVKPQDIHIPSRGAVKPDLKFGKFPLYFIFNKGQVNEKARFYAKASRYTLWLTKEGLIFDSIRGQGSGISGQDEKAIPPHSPHSPTHPLTKYERDVSRLSFIGANKNPEIVPVEEAQLRVNYFIGNDKSKWNCDVPTSMAVLYKSLYKDIDLKVYGIEKQIEYDWIVKPGGNPEDIRVEYKNVKGTRLDDEGNLLIETEFGELIHKKPVCYQKINSAQNQRRGLIHQTRVDVDGLFKKLGKNTYGFEVGEYDKNKELIIDPVVLAYSTYLGGNLEDRGYGIAVDSSENVYITGYTHSTNFPCLNQYQTDPRDVRWDVFVTKIDTTKTGASSLIYSTYLGGEGVDVGYGIAVDGSGNAYVTGKTSSKDFPTLNQYPKSCGGVFVTKIDTTKTGASSLIYSTCLGGVCGWGIAVDDTGYVYVTGAVNSSNFPIRHQYQTYQGNRDAFVTKIDTTKSGSSSLIYSTYLGSGRADIGHGIAVDSSENAYVTGRTWGNDFPTLNQYQKDQGGWDVFVTKIDTTKSGTSCLIYSTYLGGIEEDDGQEIAVDNNGNAYVTGFTEGGIPILNQYQTHPGGMYFAYLAKIDTTKSGTSSLIYSTCLGGVRGRGIAVDSSGNAYVTGILNITKIDTNQSGAVSLASMSTVTY